MREAQAASLAKLRATRDESAVSAALGALSAAGGAHPGGDTPNLMHLAVEAARARCTVGEISDALERQWGRYIPSHSVSAGSYSAEFGENAEIEAVVAEAAEFASRHGRRPRILVAKMGQARRPTPRDSPLLPPQTDARHPISPRSTPRTASATCRTATTAART